MASKFSDASRKTIGAINGLIPVNLVTFAMDIPIVLNATPLAVAVTP
jgi:hypothetical protein